MSRSTGAVKHRFTVEEYHRMGEAGIFGEDDRVELVEGEVVEMAPIRDRHAECVIRLTRLLVRFAGDSYTVSVQNPLRLNEESEPQPDLVLLERREGRTGVPIAEETLLVVEVADTSLAYDREIKLPLYARAGIPEVWIVDLVADIVEAYSGPSPGGYATLSRFQRGERVVSPTIPELAPEAADLLPPAAE